MALTATINGRTVTYRQYDNGWVVVLRDASKSGPDNVLGSSQLLVKRGQETLLRFNGRCERLLGHITGQRVVAAIVARAV